jgi:hypothetical protein
MNKLSPFYVVPAKTFFYWGFTIPKSHYPEYIEYFKLEEGNLIQDITIKINNKSYPAKVRMARINNKGKGKGRSDTVYPERNVVQIMYQNSQETQKALRKLFIYSYATTLEKDSKPKLKETLEFVHIKDNQFRVKPISKQESDFDPILRFMEDKNLFAFWKQEVSDKEKIFLDFSKKWISADKAEDYSNRNNCIYLLYDSSKKEIYIGKANEFGKRVKKGQGRIGLSKDWDKFMYFELNPTYQILLEQMESFSISLFASILKNNFKIKELKDDRIKLVNLKS